MTDAERPRRTRPTYGLPGPTSGTTSSGSPAAGGAYGVPASETGQTGHETGAYGSDPWTSGAPGSPAPTYASSVPQGGGPWGNAPVAAPHRRKGGRLVLIGIVLLVLGAIAAVVGLVLSARALSGPIDDGAAPMAGGTATIEAQAFDMYLVYVPVADADTAQCTATGTSTGSVQVVDVSGEAPVGPGGETYAQVAGVSASEATTITITCTGTTSDPLVLGPVGMLSMLLPVLLGIGLGGLAGLVGLILLIVGIVRRVRSAPGR